MNAVEYLRFNEEARDDGQNLYHIEWDLERVICEMEGFAKHHLAIKIEEAEKSNPFLAVSEEDGTYIKAFMKALSDGYNEALNKLKEINK